MVSVSCSEYIHHTSRKDLEIKGVFNLKLTSQLSNPLSPWEGQLELHFGL